MIGARQPKTDVPHELATAKYPDGSTPDPMEIVKLAMFLSVGGRGSSSKFLATCMLCVAETPSLHKKLRENRWLISLFKSGKSCVWKPRPRPHFRLGAQNIGDVEIPVGTKLVVALATANRGPRRWENPPTFQLSRLRIREHLAFGQRSHTWSTPGST